MKKIVPGAFSPEDREKIIRQLNMKLPVQSSVYPRIIVALGGVEKVLSLHAIPGTMLKRHAHITRNVLTKGSPYQSGVSQL